MHIIDYDKLYFEYNDNLLNKLRGFNNKEIYLSDWIPSENISDSLVNLIKILYDQDKNVSIKIIFSEKKNFKNILNFSKKIKNNCKISVEKNLNLSLIISNININFFSIFKKKNYKKKNINKIKYSISEKKINFLRNISQAKYKFKFEIDKNTFNKLKKKYLSFENNNYALILVINNDEIININFFLKKKIFLNRFLLENICSYSLGKNISFFKNDLLNVLEYKIRNESFKKIKGIISVFVLTNKLSEYKSMILKICKNLEIDADEIDVKSKDKINLNKEIIFEKTLLFNKEKNTNIQIIDVNNHFIKINIIDSGKKFIPKIIFEYDKYLKDSVNSKIDVYYTEKKDLNKLRTKNLT